MWQLSPQAPPSEQGRVEDDATLHWLRVGLGARLIRMRPCPGLKFLTPLAYLLPLPPSLIPLQPHWTSGYP